MSVLSLALALSIGVAPVSPASSLVRAARAVRGDAIMPTPALNQYAASRVGRMDHDGFECVPGTREACGEILGWVSGAADPYAYVVQLWLASPTHRDVLLGQWTNTGAAVKIIGDRTYFAMEFNR